MGSLSSKLALFFRGKPYADRTGLEEVYDRLVFEIERKRKDVEEKRGVIVVIASLADAAEYKSSKELATALAKTYRHSRLAQQAILEHGGTVVKFVSNGIMATFPFSGSESAATALHSAVQMQQSFSKTNQTIPNQEDQIRSQVGIAAGFVIDFSSYNPKGAQIIDPQGPVVDIVEQLVAIAKPGQILIEGTFFDALITKQEKIAISAAASRRLRGLKQSVDVYEVVWDNNPQGISFSAPRFVETGYLTTEFIVEQIRQAQSEVVITGHTNRRFTNDFDLHNLISEKVDRTPNFVLEMVFQNPYSPFKDYAQQMTRRRVNDLEPLVLDNIIQGCKLFRDLVPNVKFSASDYAMIVPFIERDKEVFFALPIRSHPAGRKVVGMTGGSYFATLAESPVALDILQNHFSQKDRLPLDLVAIAEDPALLSGLLKNRGDGLNPKNGDRP